MEDYLQQINQEMGDIESNGGWNSQYQKIRMDSIYNEYSCSEAKLPINKLLNRYRDVSPFDHSRVILNKGPCNYINASLVKVEKAGRNYILTQGPLPQTAGHFWLMVWEQRSKAVLMLNKVIEKNQIKCHQYWPVATKPSGDDLMEFEDVGLNVRLLKEEQSRHFIIRTLSIEDTSTSNTREVLQFHYTTWPDFGVPSSPRAFLHFLQAVRDSGALNSNVGPPVVHCSAGIGRSGTFCLVDSCLLMMEEGKLVNVKDILLEMRRYRMGLIQTADQLRFSYLAIKEGISQLAEGKKRFMEDEDHRDVIETDDKPLPPRRIQSLPPPHQNVATEELFRRLIEERQITIPSRPLPETPSSEEDLSDSSDGSSSDELDEDDDDESKDDSVSEVNNVVSANGSSKLNHSSGPVEDTNNINNTKTNGIETANSDNTLRRRVKNEALRDKIREIKAHQKESEAIRGIYRSPKPKRRKGSKQDVDDGGGVEDVNQVDDGGDNSDVIIESSEKL